MNVCFCCVRFSFFSIPSQDIGFGKRLLFCFEWDVKPQLNQSVNNNMPILCTVGQERLPNKAEIAPSSGYTGPPPPNALFLGPTHVHTPNGTSSVLANYVGLTVVRYERYDMRCYFNVRSKADMSWLNLPHRNDD